MKSVIILLMRSGVRVLSYSAIMVAFIFGYRFIENGMNAHAARLALSDATTAAVLFAGIGVPLTFLVAALNRKRQPR